jgi:hypothetical protein
VQKVKSELALLFPEANPGETAKAIASFLQQ